MMVLRKTMNLGHTLARLGFRPFNVALAAAVLSVFALAVSGLAWGAAAKTDKSEQAVLYARDAFGAGNSQALSRVAPQARGHVLQPYVDYWQLRLRIEQGGGDGIREYLARHEGSYLAERLRADWLRVLGKKGDWEGFRRERPALVNEDTDIACLGLLERVTSGDIAAIEELRSFWLAPRELPEGCATLAAALFEHIVAAPTRDLLQLQSLADTRTAREMVILAQMRLARSDPQAAAVHWNESLRSNFSAEDQSYVWGQIARWGARLHMPEAVNWFAWADKANLNDEQHAWRVRIALRNGVWPDVRAAIEQMSPQSRLESTWIYWRARALKEAGNGEGARAEFTRIAAEFSFYGQMAAEELGTTFKLPALAPAPSTDELAQAHASPGLQRALALFRLAMRTEAVREWNWSLRGMSDRQLIAASEIARRNEIWDRAINTADRTVAQHDFRLRYLAPYQQALTGQAKTQNVDEHWVLGLVRQESRFIWNAKSSAGAAGLMQLMPATARWVAQKMGMKNFNGSNVTSVDVNAALGVFYLRTVLNELDGHPVLASAAYNAGPGRARRWQDARPLEGAIYAESIPFDETRDYVKKVMTNAMYYAAVQGGNPRSLRERMGVIGARGRTQTSNIP